MITPRFTGDAQGNEILGNPIPIKLPGPFNRWWWVAVDGWGVGMGVAVGGCGLEVGVRGGFVDWGWGSSLGSGAPGARWAGAWAQVCTSQCWSFLDRPPPRLHRQV